MSGVPKSSDIRQGSIDVVVVEDEPDARVLLETTLTMADCAVRAVPSADEALEAIHARLPDVVVTDLRLLGGAAGWTLAQALRGQPQTRHIPLIAVTGTVDPAREVVAPFDAYLRKPLDLEVLTGLVHRLASANAKRIARLRNRGL
jgi:CheY-like chemotaxis protein